MSYKKNSDMKHRRSQGGQRDYAPHIFGKYSHFVL